MPLSVTLPLVWPLAVLIVKLPLPVAAVVTVGNSRPEVSVTGKVALLLTIRLTLADVAVWPTESVTTALIRWAPSATEPVSQL